DQGRLVRRAELASVVLRGEVQDRPGNALRRQELHCSVFDQTRFRSIPKLGVSVAIDNDERDALAAQDVRQDQARRARTHHADRGSRRSCGHLRPCAGPRNSEGSAAGYCALSWTSLNMGVVATVVTSAISTIVAKSVGETTPRSSPTFNTMSSIRPRVFIRMPRLAP